MSAFRFTLPLSVDEKDLNAGGHVSYDRYFVFFQEACFAYLAMFGLRSDGTDDLNLIAAEARCSYKKELMCGDRIAVSCRVRGIRAKSFEMQYRIHRGDSLCAEGAVTFLCFDYARRRVAEFPERLTRFLRDYEGI